MIVIPLRPTFLAELIRQCTTGLDFLDLIRDYDASPERCERAARELRGAKASAARESWNAGVTDLAQILSRMTLAVEVECFMSEDTGIWDHTPLGRRVGGCDRCGGDHLPDLVD